MIGALKNPKSNTFEDKSQDKKSQIKRIYLFMKGLKRWSIDLMGPKESDTFQQQQKNITFDFFFLCIFFFFFNTLNMNVFIKVCVL